MKSRMPARRVGAGDLGEQLPRLLRPDLPLLVDGAQHVDRLLLQAQPREERVEHAAVGVADAEPLHAERREALPHEEQDLQVGGGRVGPHDVEIDLHELAVAAALRVLSPPDLCRVPAAEGEPDLGEVGGHEPGERAP